MAQREVKVKAFAKINLSLEVLGKRPDGYHRIRTLFQSIGLADILTFREVSKNGKSGEQIILTIRPSMDIQSEDNLIFKAATRLIENFPQNRRVKIKLEKNIPIGAGLGGGSSDAASTLVGLNKLLKMGKSIMDLKKIAEGLGADVPYFLEGGLCLGQGIGEAITPMAPFFEDFHFLLLKPPLSLFTKDVYKEWDRENERCKLKSPGSKLDLSATFNQGELKNYVGVNDLETPALSLRPELKKYRNFLKNSKASFWGMTGSGPTFYAAFKGDDLHEAILLMKKATKELGGEATLTKARDCGYSVLE